MGFSDRFSDTKRRFKKKSESSSDPQPRSDDAGPPMRGKPMLDIQDKPRTPGGRKKNPGQVPGVQDSEGSSAPPGASSGQPEAPGGAGRGEDSAKAQAHAQERKEKQQTSAPGGTSAEEAVKASSDPDQAGGNKATITSTDEELPPTPDHKVLEAKWVFLGIMAFIAVCFLVFVAIFPPTWSEAGTWAIIWGFPGGLGFSFWKHKNEQHKMENNEKLNVYPGLKGMKEILGSVPSWIHYEEKERVDWLNSILRQTWPFYDPAVCAAVKESVEPLLDAYKPPGLIKKIYFRTLTFGDAPFKIDNVWVDRSTDKEICLEVAFRWAGEANIALAIEPIVSLGNLLRMVPKVSNLRVSGAVRIMMKPIVDDVPVVAAMVVALKAPPQIHFTLEVGKQIGGALVVKPIMLWLDPFLRHTLTDLFVWPNRIVVPLTADPNFDYTDLEMQHVGLLTVVVIEAHGLKKYDVMGKSDPFLELSTLPQSKEKTSVKKKTVTPTWNETKHVLVQEPRTQFLRVEMFDHDVFQPKELLNLNIIKGATEVVGAQELMGRVAIGLKQFSENPGRAYDDWHDLGKGDWSNPDGCGQGEGELHLRITYTPFEAFTRHPSQSLTGALLIKLEKGKELPARDGTTSDPFCIFKLGKHAEKKSEVISATLEPIWNQKFEWLNVDVNETLKIDCMDDDMIGDELLGKFSLPIAERLRELAPQCTDATWKEDFPLTDVATCDARKTKPDAKLAMKIQWIPYTYGDNGHQAQSHHGHRLRHRVHSNDSNSVDIADTHGPPSDQYLAMNGQKPPGPAITPIRSVQ